MKHLHDEIVAERRAEDHARQRAAIRGTFGLGVGTPVFVRARGRSVFADVVAFDGARVSLLLWESGARMRVALDAIEAAVTAYVERRERVEQIARKRTDRGER